METVFIEGFHVPPVSRKRNPLSSLDQLPGQRSTRTGVPAGHSVPGGTSTNPLARDKDSKMCEA